jgi:carboxyl-terminal processing protease
MMKARARFATLSLLVVAVVVGATVLVAAGRGGEAGEDSLYKHLTIFSEVFGLVRQAYVEETEAETLLLGAYEGAADALDAFSVYVPADAAAEYRTSRESPRANGGLFLVRDRGWLYVAGVLEGSPAERAGIERGDVVARVADRSTRDLDVWRLQAELARRAVTGTPVELELLRRGERQIVELDLAPFEVPAIARETVDGVPLLRAVTFGPGAAPAWRGALESRGAEGATRVLVDLRGAASEEVEGAFAIADLFGAGVLGSLQRRGVVVETFEDREAPVWEGEVVVLIDRGTLGAGELLAKILQGTAGARLVGESTYGWAGHRDTMELRSGALLLITDGFYAGPDGEVIDASLEPDYEIRDLWRRIGNRDKTIDDLILERGLEVLRGEVQVEAEAAAA